MLALVFCTNVNKQIIAENSILFSIVLCVLLSVCKLVKIIVVRFYN